MKTFSKQNNISFGSILLLLLTISLILSGCGSGSGGGIGGTTSVSLNLNVPSASQLVSASAQSNLAAGAVPVLVYSLKIQISGADMTTITDIINVTPGTTMTKTYNVPTGDGRTFAVTAYDGPMGTGTLLYEGTTSVNLGGGSIAIDIPMILADIADALRVLNDGDVVGANDLFRGAVVKHTGDGSASADTAHFFYAITRVFTLLFDIQSDGADDGLNDAGDILDAFGCDQNRDPETFDIHFETANSPVPPSFTGTNCPGPAYPSGGDLQGFAYDTVRAELVEAVANLDSVSEAFKITWTEPFGSAVVESDYGDVHVLKAMLKAAIASLEIQQAHNLDVDLNPFLDTATIESFLAANSGFLQLLGSGASNLSEARNYFNEALDHAEAGMDWIEGEEQGINDPNDNDQNDDWINMVGDTPIDRQDNRDDIAMARTCLSGTGTCTTEDNNTPGDTSDDDIIKADLFFNGQIDINSFIPAFNGDDPVGELPDPYFGGLIVQLEGYDVVQPFPFQYPYENETFYVGISSILNMDRDNDGTADSIDNDVYYVYGGDIYPAVSHWSKAFRDVPEDHGFVYLGAASGADGAQNFAGSYAYYFVKFRYFSGLDLGDNEVRIDEFQFLGNGTFCCDNFNSHYSGSEWWVFNNAPNGMIAFYDDGNAVMIQSPIGTTGLTVYGVTP